MGRTIVSRRDVVPVDPFVDRMMKVKPRSVSLGALLRDKGRSVGPPEQIHTAPASPPTAAPLPPSPGHRAKPSVALPETAPGADQIAAAPVNLTPSIAPTSQTTAAPDDYLSRLIKYIPAEVVAVYLAMQAIVVSAADAPAWLIWVVFSGLLVLTPVYLRRVAKVDKWLQISLSALAFVVWVFALPDGPFTGFDWYNSVYPALALIFATFVFPIIEPNG